MIKNTELDGHYEAEDLVSVWIGDFPSYQSFEDYMQETWLEDENESVICPFWKDLGISWHDSDFQEAHFEEHSISIAELLRDISFSQSYSEEVLQECRKRRIEHANSIVVICECDYPVEANFQSDYLTYLGSFPYSTGSTPFRRT